MRTLSYLFFLCCLACGVSSCETDRLVPVDAAVVDLSSVRAKVDKAEAELAADRKQLETRLGSNQKAAVVTVPAGSVDALAAAIAAAGPRGTVRLASGLHRESSSVVIPYTLNLLGQEGAVLEVTTTTYQIIAGFLDPALHLRNAPKSLIAGIDIRPSGSVGGVAVLVEDSKRSIIANNTITNHQFGVLLEGSDYVSIAGNRFIAQALYARPDTPFATGIVTMKGDHARVRNNTVTGYQAGIWASSRHTLVANNECFANLTGFVLSDAPQGLWLLPSGELSGSDVAATQSVVFRNNSYNNLEFNFQLLGEANNNLLVLNRAGASGLFDYELAAETNRFNLGFPLLETFENIVLVNEEDVYQDCGRGNWVIGGIALPANEASCL
ncbi:right-handed parallel beta-helix repeat-containing protein [Neolewinella persica]|uniref:right-handed parallel beta-helix repeat-containing protein n=1 Tax=Neolewinella persica TaxID=70998 RepID=UPI0003787741|nr:right-handed parallel beta-helix repeat-containing protein [Neolewinella persica]